MLFIVDSSEAPRNILSQYPHVVLVRDYWDDYGYKTTFHAILHLSADEKIDLSNVKILKRKETFGSTEMPKEPFEELGMEYCSIGGNLSYYEKLFMQGAVIYEPYLRGLCDVAYSDEIKANFEDLEGFRVSLLRFSDTQQGIEEARKIFKRTELPSKHRSGGFKLRFKTRIARDPKSVNIDFDFLERGALPNRINVLIGYNGTGKTRLLSNLATVASGYGYAKKEDLLNQTAGRFIDSLSPFKTVVVVSYSAFDTFEIPGSTQIEKQRLKDEGTIFSYVYCGLRECTDNHNNGEQAYRLKTPKEIEIEFLAALSRVKDAQRMGDLLEVLRLLLNDASFQRIGLMPLSATREEEHIAELFRKLSSGHKVVLKIITELTAYIAETGPTLVLIDEPETHLHPPLLAALLKSVRACLERFDAYAVIATHSPVVLQEMPVCFVHMLRRIADQSQVDRASIETFGESIGLITQEVFNLDDGSTDWHDTLRTLASQHELKEIEEMFGHSLGFAARSYVLSIRDENDE